MKQTNTINTPLANTGHSVSYTHLDVYKRQPTLRLIYRRAPDTRINNTVFYCLNRLFSDTESFLRKLNHPFVLKARLRPSLLTIAN